MSTVHPHSPPGIGRKVAFGAAWSMLLRVIDRTIGVVSIAILARLLTPEDFGIVAVAFSVIAIVEALGSLNVTAALIRLPNADRKDFDTAWTIRVITAFVLAVVIAVSALPAALFYQDARIEGILYALAVATVIGGFENIGTVKFQKELDFRRDFNFRFVTRISATAAGIIAAFILRDYWALVVGMACRGVFLVVASYVYHPYRPAFCVDRLRSLVGFSSWLLAQNLVASLNARLSIIILGRLTSIDLVAYFSVGKEVAFLATTELQAPIRRALYPGFAKLSDNIDRLLEAFLRSFGIIALLGLPCAIGIGLTADYIVHLLLGPKWLPSIPIMQVLVFSGALMSMRTASHLVYLVINRPQLTLILAGLSLTVSLPLLIFGIKSGGVIGAAWATVAVAAILLIADYAILTRVVPLRVRDLITSVWRPIVASAGMLASVFWLKPQLPTITDWSTALIGLISCSVFGAAVYTTVLLSLWWMVKRPDSAEQTILSFIAGSKFFRSKTEPVPE